MAIKKKKKDREHRVCRVCGTPVPNVDVWRGRIPVCAKTECREKVTGYGGKSKVKYVAANQLKCCLPDCDNYVPEGFFEPNVRFPVCSSDCYTHRVWGSTNNTCAYPGCSATFRNKWGNRNYCKDHERSLAEDQLYDSRCRGFRNEFDEYIKFATLSKRHMPSQKVGVSLFLMYANENGIDDLNSVSPMTITDFLTWGEKTGRPSVWNAIWPVSSFMKWMYATGRRSAPNPVIPSFHRKPKSKRLPRPYSEEEMRYIWSLLDRRGTAVVRLAVSIAEESGLRISELANVRMSDIDATKQRLFVRLPNKAMVEAWVPFGDKVGKYLPIWLAERELMVRDGKVKHDHLLCHSLGRPFTRSALHNAISYVLCKSLRGRKYNDDGLDNWSTHRLRHVMATRLVAGGANAAAIMAIGRWASFTAMQGYSQVDDAVKARGYHEAMAKAKMNREQATKTTSSFRKYVKSGQVISKAS